MGGIYVMKSLSGAEEYILLKGDVSKFRIPVLKSEIQYLDKSKVIMGISDEGGLEVPDILYYEGITFFSGRLKTAMEEEGIDYVFWKQADIHSEPFGIHETFWIIVPPRIDCVDLDGSAIDLEWDFNDGLLPMLRADKIKINEKMAGYFAVFKIAGILDNNIYVTEELAQKISSMGFEGLGFFKL